MSTQFLPAGNTLMMVAGFDVQLWDTNTWKLKRSHKFDKLGRDWSGDLITPRPLVIPNRPEVAVISNHSQRYWPILRWLGRVGRLNTFGTGRLCVIDPSHDTYQAVELHEINPIVSRRTSYGMSTVWSPDGTSVAFSQDDLVVWDLPPRPSYVAPGFATLLAGGATLLLVARFRRKGKAGESNTA